MTPCSLILHLGQLTRKFGQIRNALAKELLRKITQVKYQLSTIMYTSSQMQNLSENFISGVST